MVQFVPVLDRPQLGGRFELVRLVDEEGILILELVSEDDQRVDLRFDSYFTYRKMEEGDLLTTMNDLVSAHETVGSLYEVRDSSFLDWFNKESQGVRADQHLKHFAVFCLNDVVDVISLEKPEIRDRSQTLRLVGET